MNNDFFIKRLDIEDPISTQHNYDNIYIGLNVFNYTLNELFKIFKLNETTATQSLLYERSYNLKQHFKQHKMPEVVNFIDNATRILIEYMDGTLYWDLNTTTHNNSIHQEWLRIFENIPIDNNAYTGSDGEEGDEMEQDDGDGDGEQEDDDNDDGEQEDDDNDDGEQKEEDDDYEDDEDKDITEEEDDDEQKNVSGMQHEDGNVSGEKEGATNTNIKQYLNPIFRENYTRIISIDSYFRMNSLPSLQNITYSSIGDNYASQYSTTNFTATLSEPVTNITKLSVESVHIPNTFYNIDSAYGNNVFAFRFIDPLDTNPLKIIQLTPGNYDINLLLQDIIDKINTIFTPVPPITIAEIFYNTNVGKVFFNLPDPFEIVFYDNNLDKIFLSDGLDIPRVMPRLNYNIGWLLGFRDPIYEITTLSIAGTYDLTSDAIVDLRGPRYFIITLDDFNKNHLNKAIISCENRREIPKIPTYPRDTLTVNLQNGVSTYQQVIDGGNIDNYPITGTYPFYVRQEPKRLTQAQLYSLNEITKQQQKEVAHVIESPTENNIFAIVPNILRNNNNFGDAIVLTSNQLQENERHYFGKIDIERIAVRLYDDKGNLMNLNGTDWSLTVRALCSYNSNDNREYIHYTHNLDH